ncbi:MAG: hypothetical protein JWQ09_4309 [Segetibacter sp.]|nr:hypothetical protein [Segetibacter sp.]
MLTVLRCYGFAILLIFISFTTTAQVKIGDNSEVINPNSLLELESTTKGLLLPRLTADQITAMTNVPKGMLVFNLTGSALFLKRDTGWVSINQTNHLECKKISEHRVRKTGSLICCLLDSKLLFFEV